LVPLGAGRWPSAVPVWGVVAALVGVPLTNLVFQAGLSVSPGQHGAIRQWSLGKVREMDGRVPGEAGEQWIGGARRAALAAAAGLAVVSPLAWWCRSGGRRFWLTGLGLAVLLAVPAPVLAVGVIRAVNQPDVGWLQTRYDRTLVPVGFLQFVKA